MDVGGCGEVITLRGSFGITNICRDVSLIIQDTLVIMIEKHCLVELYFLCDL